MANVSREPLIVNAAFIPTIVNTGQTVRLRVVVVDVEYIESTEIRYAGEFQSGEV